MPYGITVVSALDSLASVVLLEPWSVSCEISFLRPREKGEIETIGRCRGGVWLVAEQSCHSIEFHIEPRGLVFSTCKDLYCSSFLLQAEHVGEEIRACCAALPCFAYFAGNLASFAV